MTERGLRDVLKGLLPKGTHFEHFESSTKPGIPDTNFCIHGTEVWCELKIITGKEKVKFQKDFSPFQWNWMLNRMKAGGICWILGARDKELWLYDLSKKMNEFRTEREKMPASPSFILVKEKRQHLAEIIIASQFKKVFHPDLL